MKMKKIGTDDIRKKRNDGKPEEETYKVRVAVTLAHYKYPQCRCARFGQSRFEPVKRTALDGKVWWCLYDRRKNEYVAWYKKKLRRQVLVQLVIDFKHGRLPYDPDPGFSKEWLMGRTAPEIAYLIDHRRLKDETY